MRTDLNMRKGKMAAQAAHASRSFLKAHLTEGAVLNDKMVEWIKGSHDTICVGVGSEAELIAIYNNAMDRMVWPVYMVDDLGKTEFHGVKTKTCLAIGPCDAEQINEITGGLKLL